MPLRIRLILKECAHGHKQFSISAPFISPAHPLLSLLELNEYPPHTIENTA